MANDCIVQFNDKPAAIANLNKALELNAGFFEAILRCADIRIETGEYKKAEKEYLKAVSLNKKSFKFITIRVGLSFCLTSPKKRLTKPSHCKYN